MPTVNYGIATTADDTCYLGDEAGAFDSYAITGNSSPLGVPEALVVGLRFVAVAVPQGATISSASLNVKRNDVSPAYGVGAEGTNFGSLKGVNLDTAPAWTTTPPNLIAKTTQSVTVTNSATVAYDVTAIVQAIVNRAGWASGNALGFAGDPTGANGFIEWIDRTASATDCAQLSITFTTGGTPPPARRAPRHSYWL